MEEPPDLNTSWPPPILRRTPEAVTDSGPDPADEFLYQGWRLLILGFCCAPPVFLPLALWQGIAASRRRSGAGTRLLLATAGVAAFWTLSLLFLIFIRN